MIAEELVSLLTPSLLNNETQIHYLILFGSLTHINEHIWINQFINATKQLQTLKLEQQWIHKQQLKFASANKRRIALSVGQWQHPRWYTSYIALSSAIKYHFWKSGSHCTISSSSAISLIVLFPSASGTTVTIYVGDASSHCSIYRITATRVYWAWISHRPNLCFAFGSLLILESLLNLFNETAKWWQKNIGKIYSQWNSIACTVHFISLK